MVSFLRSRSSLRGVVLIGLAAAVGAWLAARLFRRGTPGTPPPAEPGHLTAAEVTGESGTTDAPLRRPPSADTELAVLTDRPRDELDALLDRTTLGAGLRPAQR